MQLRPQHPTTLSRTEHVAAAGLAKANAQVTDMCIDERPHVDGLNLDATYYTKGLHLGWVKASAALSPWQQ